MQEVFNSPYAVPMFRQYAEEIPVVLIDGRVHTIWRVEPERLRTALRAAVR